MNMGCKRLVLRLAAMLLLSQQLGAVTNKTFFKPRSISDDAVLQNNMSLFLIDRHEAPGGLIISNNTFYQASDNDSDLAKYFFFDNKTELVVAGLGSDIVTTGKPFDVAAEWLNIASNQELDTPYPDDNDKYTFSSKIKISPELRQVGTNILLQKNLPHHFYIAANFPIVHVETNMRLTESDVKNERSPANVTNERLNTIHNAYEGLNNPMMKYGKMSNQWQKRDGFADIQLKLGYKGTIKRSHVWDLYAKASIPTGYKPTAEYAFEPLVGNCGHFGLGGGLDLDLKLSKHFYFINAIDYEYLFESTEKRSLDLISNGPWSRYMLATNGKVDDRPIPMINFLTKDLHITPGSVVNFLSNVHFSSSMLKTSRHSFEMEVGYNFFYKDSEDASLKYAWNEQIEVAYFDENNMSSFNGSKDVVSDLYASNKINSNITAAVADTPVLGPDTYIKSNNLNISSAAHPSFCSNKVYATIGFLTDWHENVLGFNVGGSYEIASSNKSLSLWGVWLGLNVQI